MSTDAPRPTAAMEGEGSYNRYARLPAGGAALAIPHLAHAAGEVLFGADEPIVITDYGSSQGKNSLAPMRIAINTVLARAGNDRPILVYHVDRPSNDFNSLFEVLDKNPDRYSLNDSLVFPCAIGRSFYENVLPASSVHIAWSAYAAMWVRAVPALIPGHFAFPRSSGEVRAAFERQGARDWEAFLRLRALELRPGGCLVICMPGADANGVSVFEGIWDHANEELADMVNDGAISVEERRRMVLPVWPRRIADLAAPFGENARFGTLILKHAETRTVPDVAWGDFERDQDARTLAKKHAMFFRSIFTPTLATAVDAVRAGAAEAYTAFADRLTQGLERRVRAKPAHMHSLVHTLVIRRAT
jgi:SAM dependent carboxyl methyltransferase